METGFDKAGSRDRRMYGAISERQSSRYRKMIQEYLSDLDNNKSNIIFLRKLFPESDSFVYDGFLDCFG